MKSKAEVMISKQSKKDKIEKKTNFRINSCFCSIFEKFQCIRCITISKGIH